MRLDGFFVTAFFCVSLWGVYCLLPASAQDIPAPRVPQKETGGFSIPFSAGETLSYAVYLKSLRIGTSVLTYHGIKEHNNTPYQYFTFITDVRAFYDEEHIWADVHSFLPRIVIRNIREMGIFPYVITEQYDQREYTLTIIKKGKFLSKKRTIRKDGPFQNAILLPYYYRVHPVSGLGEKVHVRLPLAEFDVAYVAQEQISTPAGTVTADRYESYPSKFTFWLSTDERKVPFKIQSLTFTGYSMVLVSQEKGSGN